MDCGPYRASGTPITFAMRLIQSFIPYFRLGYLPVVDRTPNLGFIKVWMPGDVVEQIESSGTAAPGGRGGGTWWGWGRRQGEDQERAQGIGHLTV